MRELQCVCCMQWLCCVFGTRRPSPAWRLISTLCGESANRSFVRCSSIQVPELYQTQTHTRELLSLLLLDPPKTYGSGCLGAAAPVTGAAADEYNLNVVDCNASVTVARRSSISVSGGLGGTSRRRQT